MKLLGLASLVSLVAACGGSSHPATVGNNGTATPPSQGVRAIDWANHTYSIGEDGTYTVVGGVHEIIYDNDGNEVAPGSLPDDQISSRGEFSVNPAVFGDVTGDGVEEALIVSSYNGGGSGFFTNLAVYQVVDGKEVDIGGIPGGDRGDGGISEVQLDGQVVLVTRYESQEGDGACCPSRVANERWRWDGKAFVEDAAARTLTDIREQ